jgi:hypothetical protein
VPLGSSSDRWARRRVLVSPRPERTLHVVDVRAGLIEHLELTGYPQVLMRLGHPQSVAGSSARKVLSDIVRAPRERR